MKRAEFIKDLLALGVGLPFISVLLQACNEEEITAPNFEVNFKGKVLIIGAGSASITAGYLLKRHNIDFEIIEANADFGGRVKRAPNFADFPIDLGAEWIHDEPSILAKLLTDPTIKDNVDLITYSPESIYNWKNGKLKKQNWASNFYSEYKFKKTTWYGFFEKYMIPSINSNISYNSPVTEIDYSTNGVVVKTQSKTFTGDRVLVTVPTKILQQNSISFIPSLPQQKIDAINSIEMPDGIKVFIEFSEKFYPDALMFGNLLTAFLSASKTFYDAAFRKNTSMNIMGVFAVSDGAKPYTSLNSDQEIIDKILDEIDEMFDGKGRKFYKKHVIQNWSKEPYIGGSYSYNFKNDQNSTVNTILTPVENKIYFSGEALSIDNQATVHGAALSSYSVIENLLKTP